MGQELLEKKKYRFEEFHSLILEKGTVFLQDLIDTKIEDQLFTLFINHSVVIRDVVNLSFISYENKTEKPFIHGIADVYDRVLREKLYNGHQDKMKHATIENDHLADMVIRSNVVINVLDLNVANFIQKGPGDSVALVNKYLIELYTGWHTQLHHRDREFFQLFF